MPAPVEILGLPDRRWLVPALALNLDPFAAVDPSWIDDLPHGDLVRRLRGSPRAAKGVGAYLFESLELDSTWCADFSRPSTRILLLPGDLLRRLCLYLGLALSCERLRNEIDGARVRSVRDSVGTEAYDFALKRAPLLGRLPQATPLAPELEPRLSFQLAGAGTLAADLTSGANGGPLRRLTLKLPKRWSTLIDPEMPTEAPDADYAPLLRKLLDEVSPQWSPLFV